MFSQRAKDPGVPGGFWCSWGHRWRWGVTELRKSCFQGREKGVKTWAQRSSMELWSPLVGERELLRLGLCLINSILSDQGAGTNMQGGPSRGDPQQPPRDAKLILLLSLHPCEVWLIKSSSLPCKSRSAGFPLQYWIQVKATWLIQLLLAWPLLPYSIFYCISPRWLSLPFLYQLFMLIPLCCSCLPRETQCDFYILAYCPALIAPAFPLADPSLPSHPVGLCMVISLERLFVPCVLATATCTKLFSEAMGA